MTSVGSPDARLRTFISRILRLKSDQDDITTDIQAVYAEAKAEGYDKTAMGQVVSVIRKRLKDPSKFEERSAVVQMYLDAFERAEPHTHARARVREATPHDRETGEVLGDAPAPAVVAEAQALADMGVTIEVTRATGVPLPGPDEPDPIRHLQAAVDAVPAARPQPYRVTGPAPAPVAPDPDLSPLIADAAARQAAARRLLGQAEISEAAE